MIDYTEQLIEKNILITELTELLKTTHDTITELQNDLEALKIEMYEAMEQFNGN